VIDEPSPLNDTWRKFNGSYRKWFHLAFIDGVIYAAWPNAGTLNCGVKGKFGPEDGVLVRECSYEEYERALHNHAPQVRSRLAN